MESLRKPLIDSGLSKSATSLISSARRPSSNSDYDSFWGNWVSWCSRKEIDPVLCSVSFILDFLAELFDLGYNYRSVISYRSAISANDCYVEGKPVRQHKQVCALLRGVFTKKPPQPRYAFFFYLGFLSQSFTNHRTAGEGGGHFFNSSLPLPHASQTLRH